VIAGLFCIMKIALAQLNYHIGNFKQNANKIIEAISAAKSKNADLIVFAELAISGYPPRDLLEFDHFIETCFQEVEAIANHCQGIAAIIGLPTKNKKTKGKKLYNSAAFLTNGKIQSIHNKGLLPTYDVFDEYRYFEPADSFECIHYQGKKIALTICEDLWNVQSNAIYKNEPMEQLIKDKPDLMINIAASPFHTNQQKERLSVLQEKATEYNLPLVYVNHIGAQTELIFDGNSMALNAKGEVLATCDDFDEKLTYINFQDNTETLHQVNTSDITLIHKALVLGIKDYFKKLGFTKAMVGLSGGIDSAVTFALAAEALGAQNVLGVLMPSQFSSDHSINDAQQLADNIKSPTYTLPVQNIFDSFMTELARPFKNTTFGLAEENLQARIRGAYLMTLSNKFGHIVLNTSNKSEAAVGYGTLYGDMCGGLAVLGDVYKTKVWELARHINKDKEIIPRNSISKPPSAELRPDQLDSDSLPDYDFLDAILEKYIEQRLSPQQIKDAGFNDETVDKVLRLVNINEYKRFQTPPILRVTKKAFGMGRRMPIVGKYLS
jgi:NAD+ synthase (glutamine-hydrolysing)